MRIVDRAESVPDYRWPRSPPAAATTRTEFTDGLDRP